MKNIILNTVCVPDSDNLIYDLSFDISVVQYVYMGC